MLRTVQAPTLGHASEGRGRVPDRGGTLPGRHIPGARSRRARGRGPPPGRRRHVGGDRRDRPVPRLGTRRGGIVRSGARVGAVHGHRGIDGEGGRARRPAMAGDRRGPPRDGPSHPREVSRGRDRHRGRRLLRDVRRTRPCGALRAGDRRGCPGARARGPGRGPYGRGRDDRREGRRHRGEHRSQGRRDGRPVGGPRLLDREGPRRRVRSRLRGPWRARPEGHPGSLAPVPVSCRDGQARRARWR